MSSLEQINYYPFGMLMPGRNDNVGKYIYGFGGHLKDDEIKGSGNHLSFEDYGYDPRTGRRWNVDPKFNEIAGISPYAYALDNPIVYIDKDGELPILPLLLKAGSAGAADMLTQAAVAYFFDPKVETASQAFEKVNWIQVARSSAEGLIPWRTPGGKIGKAAATAVGDVLVNAVSQGTDYNGEQALQDFAVGFVGDLGGGEIGDFVSKYGAERVAIGLSKMGFDDKKIEEILTGAGTTWKGPVEYSDIADPLNAGAGKKFTQNQKGKILDKNQAANNGNLRSDADGTFLNKSKKGGSDPLGAEVDHINAKSKGGSNSNSNAQVLSKKQNATKSNR
jgi:RHS repeat-associated protein